MSVQKVSRQIPISGSDGARSLNSESNPSDSKESQKKKDGREGWSQQDKEEIKEMVDQNAENDTGRPTGAIYGNQGDEKSVSNKFNR